MLYPAVQRSRGVLRQVEDFGDRKGVVGFMVTTPRYKPVHDNAYMKTYRALEERGLPLSFHAACNWGEPAFADLQPLHRRPCAGLHVVTTWCI